MVFASVLVMGRDAVASVQDELIAHMPRVAAEQDRSFLISTDGVTWRTVTAFTESPDKSAGTGSAFFLREYTLALPDETYFVQIKFANWVWPAGKLIASRASS